MPSGCCRTVSGVCQVLRCCDTVIALRKDMLRFIARCCDGMLNVTCTDFCFPRRRCSSKSVPSALCDIYCVLLDSIAHRCTSDTAFQSQNRLLWMTSRAHGVGFRVQILWPSECTESTNGREIWKDRGAWVTSVKKERAKRPPTYSVSRFHVAVSSIKQLFCSVFSWSLTSLLADLSNAVYCCSQHGLLAAMLTSVFFEILWSTSLILSVFASNVAACTCVLWLTFECIYSNVPLLSP